MEVHGGKAPNLAVYGPQALVPAGSTLYRWYLLLAATLAQVCRIL